MSDVELLWRQSFADPSQWRDRRNRQKNPAAPDFEHKRTNRSLWIDGPNNPGWVMLMLEGKWKADLPKNSVSLPKRNMWEDYFKDSAIWSDKRMTKQKNTKNPDSKHRIAEQTSPSDELENPEWIVSRFQNEISAHVSDEDITLMSSEQVTARHSTVRRKEMEIKRCKMSYGNELKAPTKVAWESLSAEHAVALLEQQLIPPSVDILISVMQKCRNKGSLVYSKCVHAYLCKHNLHSDSIIGNFLVSMLVDCGSLQDAQQVFDSLQNQYESSWSSLIHGYCNCGHFGQALLLYDDMRNNHVQPSSCTFLSLMKACVKLGYVERGRDLHKWIVILGYEKIMSVGNLLVDMYAKFHLLLDAKEVLLRHRLRDVIAWTALIAGYAELGLDEEAWECLQIMHKEGVSADTAAHVCSLKAFSNAGAVDYGRNVHNQILIGGFERDLLIGSTLVDMYCKHGSLMEAWAVFNKASTQSVVAWTALIAGHARQGEYELVIELFERMRFQGVHPNDTTFLIILSVCNHAGMVEKGLFYFELMKNEYGLLPAIKHHNCMLDLLSRSGQLNAALLMLENMPTTPNLISWKVILSACQKFGNVEIAKQCYEVAVKKNINQNAVLALACKIFNDADMWRDLKIL